MGDGYIGKKKKKVWEKMTWWSSSGKDIMGAFLPSVLDRALVLVVYIGEEMGYKLVILEILCPCWLHSIFMMLSILSIVI